MAGEAMSIRTIWRFWGGVLAAKVELDSGGVLPRVDHRPSHWQIPTSPNPVHNKKDWRLCVSMYTERYMKTLELNPSGYNSSAVVKTAGFKSVTGSTRHRRRQRPLPAQRGTSGCAGPSLASRPRSSMSSDSRIAITPMISMAWRGFCTSRSQGGCLRRGGKGTGGAQASSRSVRTSVESQWEVEYGIMAMF